jgi:hypothetical protein
LNIVTRSLRSSITPTPIIIRKISIPNKIPRVANIAATIYINLLSIIGLCPDLYGTIIEVENIG